MRGIGRILIILLVVVVLVGAAGFFLLPSTASRTQTFTVDRPPASVFARLATAPEGFALGEGVTQTRIVEAANNRVVADLAFADGGTGRAIYTVEPEGQGSEVSVRIEQNLGSNPLDRVQGLTGGEVGPIIEAAATAVTTDLNVLPAAGFGGLAYEVVQVEARPFFYIQNCSPQDAAAIKDVVAQSLLAIRPIMARHRLQQAGPPIAVETSWDDNQYCFQIGLPFTGTPPRVLAVGTAGQTPAGAAIRVHYTGTEEQVIPTYDQMEALIASARLTQGRSFEIYNDDPTVDGGSVDREIYYLVTGDTARLAQFAPSAAPAAAPAATPAAAPAATPAAEAPPTPAETPAPAPAQ